MLGVAVSQQATSRSKEVWKDAIRWAARKSIPHDAWVLTDPLAVTIFLFPNDAMQGDLDNRLKPILDAMTGCIYSDDQQVERIVAQRFEPGRVFSFRNPSRILGKAMRAPEPSVYIRVTDDVHGAVVISVGKSSA